MIARESAYTYKGKATDVRQIGRELGVRYVLEGSVRQIGATCGSTFSSSPPRPVRTSGRTGSTKRSANWPPGSSRSSRGCTTRSGFSLVEIESARSQRERPTNPDAFDLILRARSMRQLPPTPQRDKEIAGALRARAAAGSLYRFMPWPWLPIS